MSIREQIEQNRPELRALCERLGVPGLRVRIDAEAWAEVTFIGNIDISRLQGYADRFFDLESGLLGIFHRHIHLIDEEAFKKQQTRHFAHRAETTQDIELLHAS
jgi:hypothetical protein